MDLLLHRLLRLPGHRLRGRRPARVDDRHRHLDRAGQPLRGPAGGPVPLVVVRRAGGGGPLDGVPRARRPRRPLARLRRAWSARSAPVPSAPGEAARAVCRLVHRQIDFLPGATDVESPAVLAWEQRAGVCQDMVHLAIGGLRTLGIPARYVSGYVHPVEDPVVGETVAGDSRAWLEWWDDGWQGFDPSTDTAPNERYVAIGHGRDYGDVPPLRGIYTGAQTARLDVSVEITRLA
ncbi:transglutaminase family protein [Nocardioides sp. W3-2-3]|uniref:transglutaminase-like domain-containing protein n=1 Tax=Nocardioides convexus TaxID=2712224 RepID=UPI0024184AF1|nr:transglutaminase family protein [Nocardioides convexus]NGZ99459.1 transglutaminase family protein [Nocardioides convexus]